ncbi:MAG: hypothetical protein HKL90_12645 [Elusimicrobia bacterium]|nr:hypothetical protein [Elusimicrobiota bacterium]
MDYNEILTNGLTDVQADLQQKAGASRVLSVIGDAMGAAAAAGVPWAGQASAVIKIVTAISGALSGAGQPAIDLDKLFVSSETDDLKAKGVDVTRIDAILGENNS